MEFAIEKLENLSVMREKATTALDCILYHSNCPQVQTLTYITNDYLLAMGETIAQIQKETSG